MLLKRKGDSIVKFKWRDQKGTFHDPGTMSTHHLFYVLLMVWNHSVPEKMKLRPFREYLFGSFYTGEYMKETVKVLGAELDTRTDLSPRMVHIVKQIHEIIQKGG